VLRRRRYEKSLGRGGGLMIRLLVDILFCVGFGDSIIPLPFTFAYSDIGAPKSRFRLFDVF